jgi:hypothetical protein
MEFERKHWLRSQVPTGYSHMKAHSFRSKAIHESEYNNLEKLHKDGRPTKEIAKLFGCSEHSVKVTLKHIESLKQ